MTDLEKRADEYAIKVAEKNAMPKDGFTEHLIILTYLDATKAETALLSQHILDLQKDKGKLTDENRELKETYRKQRNKRIDELQKKNHDLEAQIEKMKCCGNCQKLRCRFDSKININILYCSDSDMKQIEVGFNMCCCKWEIKEK